MSEWRPEGWENPHDSVCEHDTELLHRWPAPKDGAAAARLHQCERIAYRAGADAMLAALRKTRLARYRKFRGVVIDEPWNDVPNEDGCAVFIPDQPQTILDTGLRELERMKECGVPADHFGMPNSEARKRMEGSNA